MKGDSSCITATYMKKLIVVKKILAFVTCSAISAGIVAGYPSTNDSQTDVSAKTIAEIQEERKANEAKIAEYESKINELETNKQNQKAYQETLSDQIYLIQQNILLLNNELDKLNDDIAKTESNISKLDSDIGIQQELIDSNIELFKKRLCTMYVSGNEQLAEVVLGSASFYDMMSRMEMVNRIASYDEELINKLLDEIDDLEKTKKDLELEKIVLEGQHEEQEKKITEKSDEIEQLNSKMVQTQEIIDRIQLEQIRLDQSKTDTQKYLQELDDENAKIEAEIQRNAEEAQRRYEEEQKRIAQEQEAIRLENERIENEKRAEAEKTSRENASREQASIEEASRQEASREVEKQEEASREIERQEEASREAERQETSREIERQEASREAERQETSREIERQEASREAERQETSREIERQEASREAERQETSRELERQEASREAERQEASRQAELLAQTTVTTIPATTTTTTTTELPVYTTSTTSTTAYNNEVSEEVTTTTTTVSTTVTTTTTSTTSTTTTTTTTTIPAPSSSGFIWPTPGYYYISSGFGARWGTTHKGIDIGDAGIMGASVCASKSGTVTYVYNSCTHNYAKTSSCGCGGGYGNYIIIQHDGTYSTLYGHLTSASVSVGDYVQQGQVIGTVGSTGWSTGAHLHFEVRVNGKQQDPLDYVSQ